MCLNKGSIICKDLATWLFPTKGLETSGDRIAKFEKEYWNKDISIFSISESTIAFKDKRDGKQCIISL